MNVITSFRPILHQQHSRMDHIQIHDMNQDFEEVQGICKAYFSYSVGPLNVSIIFHLHHEPSGHITR